MCLSIVFYVLYRSSFYVTFYITFLYIYFLFYYLLLALFYMLALRSHLILLYSSTKAKIFYSTREGGTSVESSIQSCIQSSYNISDSWRKNNQTSPTPKQCSFFSAVHSYLWRAYHLIDDRLLPFAGNTQNNSKVIKLQSSSNQYTLSWEYNTTTFRKFPGELINSFPSMNTTPRM